MKIYISGPMTGIEDFNRKAFKDAEHMINNIPNYLAVNPHVCCEGMPNDSTWVDYMKTDIVAMMECDALFMLSGWEKSVGATIEHNLANELKYPILYSKDELK